jgi:hypothetical protein
VAFLNHTAYQWRLANSPSRECGSEHGARHEFADVGAGGPPFPFVTNARRSKRSAAAVAMDLSANMCAGDDAS